MSQSHQTPKPVIVQNETQAEVVEKKSLVKRGVNFVKSHKKTAIAVAALAGLVGMSAYAGRATAPSNDNDQPLELESNDSESDETQTTVA